MISDMYMQYIDVAAYVHDPFHAVSFRVKMIRLFPHHTLCGAA